MRLVHTAGSSRASLGAEIGLSIVLRSLNKSIPSGRNSKCKATEMERRLTCSRNRMQASAAGVWREEGEVWYITLNRYARTRDVELPRSLDLSLRGGF